MEGARDPPAAWKRRRGAVTVAFLAVLPLLILLFLLGDRAADTQLWSQVKHKSPSNDRLLGGLLSPDSDEPACRSPYEASKRWKTSPFPVSPHLVRKVRQYEANHRRCGPGTARYREAMAQLESSRNGDRGECRYVVWIPIEGLGNRMISLVSTFLYALLTGRVLLVLLHRGGTLLRAVPGDLVAASPSGLSPHGPRLLVQLPGELRHHA